MREKQVLMMDHEVRVFDIAQGPERARPELNPADHDNQIVGNAATCMFQLGLGGKIDERDGLVPLLRLASIKPLSCFGPSLAAAHGLLLIERLVICS